MANTVTVHGQKSIVTARDLVNGQMFRYPEGDNVYMMTDGNTDAYERRVIQLRTGVAYGVKIEKLVVPYVEGTVVTIQQGK